MTWETAKEAACRLQVHAARIHNWGYRGLIPKKPVPSRFGRRCAIMLFDCSKLPAPFTGRFSTQPLGRRPSRPQSPPSL